MCQAASELWIIHYRLAATPPVKKLMRLAYSVRVAFTFSIDLKMKFINLSFEKHLHLLWSSGNFSPVVT